MSGKITPMSKIKQLIRLWAQGREKRYIARTLEMSRNTVKGYITKLTQGNWDTSVLLKMEDEELRAFIDAGNAAYSDNRFDHLKDHLDQFCKDLTRTGVTRQLLWEEYLEKRPDGYRYTQFCFHLDQHLKSRNSSMVLEHRPGDKLFVDFAGKTASYVDKTSGELIDCQLFVACLPFSDYGYVIAVPSQSIEDFIFAMVCCLSFLGGVPAAIVPDNLKSAVTKASRYEPVISAAFEQLANHYDTTILPARVSRPKDKALVENHVRLIYQRVLAPLRNQVFFSLQELNEALMLQNKRLNQRRMQQKPHTRQELFLASEKPLLKSLPTSAFELEYQQPARVQQNNHVYLGKDRHYYSVPWQYIGKQAKIIFTRSLVRIYIGSEKVATHPRKPNPGRYSTNKEHLCSHHQHYLERSPEYYVNRARKCSATLGEFFSFIFESKMHPEQLYRTCDGLLNLHKAWAHSPATFDTACRIALNNQQRSWRFVQQVLQNHAAHAQPEQPAILPEHDNLRGSKYYK